MYTNLHVIKSDADIACEIIIEPRQSGVSLTEVCQQYEVSVHLSTYLNSLTCGRVELGPGFCF